jgi:predicted RNA-binding Zn ribbon-like protein
MISSLASPETKIARRQPPKFELIAGNVCLDFINTLDDRPASQPKELLKNYYELARFGEDTGILTPQQVDFFYERVHLIPDEAKEAMRRAISLREALYSIFSAVIHRQTAPGIAIERLNGNIHETVMHMRLAQVGGRLEWRFDDLASSCYGVLWPITRAAAELLASPDLALVRACSSPTCQWLFLDTSKNHHRRWCNMKVCGNRTKARKFYAKKKS